MAVQLKSLALLFLFVGALCLHAVRSSGQDVIVTFIMVQRAEIGQVFKIVGNSDKLGNWEPSRVENMTSTPGDAWAISVKLTKGAAYEYKPIVGEDVIVTFVLVQRVMSGRQFKIVGNAPEMGSWVLSKVENMTQTPVDVWASAVVCFVSLFLCLL
ncbi:hypothetical protein SUGI_0706140 [Cryptomeria japonica]|nr:hypothetical protein SUGI_0706140 [Cryptomeria japonica]